MTRILRAVLLALCLSPVPGFAAEPVADETHAVRETGWRWQMNEGAQQSIVLSAGDEQTAEYDISECMFCSGEEDNCDEDGIYPVSLPDNEPAIAVICHKGAHSQRLQVLAPMRDAEKPVFEVTGDYWVNVELAETGLSVTYDRRKAEGVIATLMAKWPPQ